CVMKGALGVQPLSFTTSDANVTDSHRPASHPCVTGAELASCVVQEPSHALGGSKAVPGPVLGHIEPLTVAVAGSAHVPVGGLQVHGPHVGAGCGPYQGPSGIFGASLGHPAGGLCDSSPLQTRVGGPQIFPPTGTHVPLHMLLT